ncbi:hypothetical protein LCGC14_2154250 [marine sediment metagenome]|uniref:Uncharacterized protein n=1 Tax=marine sediment metagenome TaxID=412755 RepID=A0A0F9DUU8_9ZZZZ
MVESRTTWNGYANLGKNMLTGCLVGGATPWKENGKMTKEELVKFLELFTDDIEIKIKGGGFQPVYTCDRKTGVGRVDLIPNYE